MGSVDLACKMEKVQQQSLHRSEFEHDSCGIGFVTHLKGKKSHSILEKGLLMLHNMEHRGACGCEKETGDGAGMLIQTPHQFLLEECQKIGIDLPNFGEYGVGMIMFPVEGKVREACKERLLEIADELELEILGFRTVPTDNSTIGKSAKATELKVEQIFIKQKNPGSPDELERRLFVYRKYTTHSIGSTRKGRAIQGNDYEYYWISLSYKVIVYKGQLRTDQLPEYFPDLRDQRVVTALAMVHSRFSTNTTPKWKLAQPFRYTAHNGEINTIRGNVNWMKSKQALFESARFTPEEFKFLLPICDKTHSDSANLDSIIEMLTLAGRSLPHAMMMVIPEAWQDNPLMERDKKAFYEFHASLMEPWDGPASICFTDGKVVGATLDRNGLRPSRYLVTEDDLVVMSSEAGALEIDEATIISKGRLQPGKMFVADLEQGRIISDDELKRDLFTSQPYLEWVQSNKLTLEDIPIPVNSGFTPNFDNLITRQTAFGFTSEDIKMILAPMAQSGTEPVGAMGADIPLAVLSDQPQHLSNYFKQMFAQVSNPPIDPIRERMVMSLFTKLGSNLNALSESPEHCRKILIEHPLLSNLELEKLRGINQGGFESTVIDITYGADYRPGDLEIALDNICHKAEQVAVAGKKIIILSDRNVGPALVPIPSLLALSTIHHYLVSKKLRANVGLVVEAGDVIETHHFATLIGYGANAINPYLALETLSSISTSLLADGDINEQTAFEKYQKAIGYGLLKIFSKMGISTLQSYQGAQIFEIVGINQEVVDKSFTKSVSRIGGLSYDDIARESLQKHHSAFHSNSNGRTLPEGGVYQWRKSGEHHLFNPETIHLLQRSTQSNDYELYKRYAKLVNDQTQKASTLRGLLDFADREPIPLGEVESAESIFRRFASGAMSFGSISHEAHSTLAVAMNRIGGKSNSGEGGEDEVRFFPKSDGNWERSAIKQVASGRFGVTSYYLANASELQIKIAQGAKPGEGGQLPGHKVDEWIGRVRHSTPGVGLISPPPHHDIYSIEDLAQLIFDLKNANREARINVKLVAEAGVGTIASGVAKAKADVVMISGHDGGTGASPISSIRHAGLPWELGLAETQQALVENGLRSRIVVQVDGQIKTGRDLAMAALLGAEEWGVATAALVVEGCVMMRKCHLNTCPVGIATQNPELRKLFTGKAEHMVNLFRFLAEDLRGIMAELGFKTVNEMVGRVDLLESRKNLDHWKLRSLNLNTILYKVPNPACELHQTILQDHEMENILDWELLKKSKSTLRSKSPVSGSFKIRNTNRAVGALLSHEISKKYRGEGLPERSLHFKFTGSAGQSFGAFGAKGLTLELEGESNDYLGKGLSGANLIIYPNRKSTLVAHENIIVGNVAFYGATQGEAYINGLAGERFCVRNSGVKAVVEGVGDHGCEYMTGGIAVILGETGRNFAAGMSGGMAYVFDPQNMFQRLCNHELVDLDPLETDDLFILSGMIEKHLKFTRSQRADEILKRWGTLHQHFVKVMPRDYKAVLQKKSELMVAG